ncbi:MAG: ERCC4 domain-containing protein [Candidatus Pacearchaeota archaeon]
MIIADKREKNSAIIAELKARGLEVEERLLPVGDYIIGNTIIERKNISDFISSMINKRLVRQLQDLKEAEIENKLLILEGFEEQELFGRGNLNDNAIRGMLLSILFDYKIPIIFTKNPEDSCDYLEVLYRRQGKKKTEISLVAKPRFSNIYEQQEFILESFPGIGKALAKEILSKFGSIKNFINANESELASIKKLGQAKARALRRLIEAEYKKA